MVFGIAYMFLLRYEDSANAKHIPNQLRGHEKDQKLKENLEKYPSTLQLYQRL